MTRISSRSNPKIKQVRALRQRKERDASGLFVVEGIHHVGEAVEAGAELAYVCYAPELLKSPYAFGLLQRLQEQGTECYAVEADVFALLAEKENPQGILAVAHCPGYSLGELSPVNFSWGVALVSPQDPGNIGAILRSVDAVGAGGLLLLDASVDPYHPGAVRASMGALFTHPLVQASFDEFAAWARRHAYHVYGTSAHGSQDYRSVETYQHPAILLLGSEQKGLLPEQIAVCEKLICLPMRGKVTSLNLGVAAGILLYEMLDKLQS